MILCISKGGLGADGFGFLTQPVAPGTQRGLSCGTVNKDSAGGHRPTAIARFSPLCQNAVEVEAVAKAKSKGTGKSEASDTKRHEGVEIKR